MRSPPGVHRHRRASGVPIHTSARTGDGRERCARGCWRSGDRRAAPLCAARNVQRLRPRHGPSGHLLRTRRGSPDRRASSASSHPIECYDRVNVSRVKKASTTGSSRRPRLGRGQRYRGSEARHNALCGTPKWRRRWPSTSGDSWLYLKDSRKPAFSSPGGSGCAWPAANAAPRWAPTRKIRRGRRSARRTQQDWGDVERELVDDSGDERLPNGGGAARDVYAVVAGRLTGQCVGGVEAVGDEVEGRPALHLDRLAGVMGEHEHRCVVRRLGPPPAAPVLLPLAADRPEQSPPMT